MALRQRLQLCLQFPLPILSLRLLKIPAKKASPSPQIQLREGVVVARRLGRKKSPAADPPANFWTSLEPRWKHTCESGQVQRAKQLVRSPSLQEAGAPLGSAAFWGLAHRRVRQSLTLGDHSSWTHSARPLGGEASPSQEDQ